VSLLVLLGTLGGHLEERSVMRIRKYLSSLSALSVVLVLGLPTAIQAQEADLQTQHTALREAVCDREWAEAIALVDQMVASPEITSAYQQMLLEYRVSLVQWNAMYEEEMAVLGCSVGGGGVEVTYNWEGAINMVRGMRPYWSGYAPGRGLYDFEREARRGGGGSSSPAAASGDGNCENPDDIASDGTRCGDRAASVRPGGR